jgi:hypothetical protein
MQEKTEYLRYDISIEQSLVDRFEEIDQKCQDAFENYYGDEIKLLEDITKDFILSWKKYKIIKVIQLIFKYISVY